MMFSRTIHCVLVSGATWLSSCAPTPPNACTPEALRDIELRYQASLVAACGGQSTCEQREAIDQKFRAEREAWVRCEP
jgi:hypothetical protein